MESHLLEDEQDLSDGRVIVSSLVALSPDACVVSK